MSRTKPAHPTLRTLVGAAALLLLVVSCEDDGGQDEHDTGTAETGNDSNDTDEPPPPPSEGFRVFPKFMLQDVPAIVTIDIDAVPEPCVLDDDPAGGYLCDGTGHPAGLATIRVERDGFETAERHPEFFAGVIDGLDVHLAVAGGPPGTWSECVAGGMFETCADVCVDQGLSCAVTSCATGQDEWPIATLRTYEAELCELELEGVASSCDDPLPQVPSLVCCCTG